ncbi:MAG: S9 family peptidase [Calditrichaeota bacterium]|nr:S9 family peptidase [Calditrichota bacterium]MCB9365609.1 S9 family peptidase [Calditrichota bacterium]
MSRSSRAPKKVPVSIHDFKKFEMPKSLAVSPDGKFAAYTRSWVDEKKNKTFANLHILDLSTGQSTRWTSGDHTDRSPVWSRDGKKLTFFRNEKGEDRIYCLNVDGGSPVQLWKGRGSLASLAWACDDTCLVVKFRKADPDADAEKAIAEGREPESKAPVVRRITRLFYRLDGVGFFPQDRYHFYKLELASGKWTQLTKGQADDGAFAVSADSNILAYVANSHRDPDQNQYDNDIVFLNLKSGRSKTLDGPQGEKGSLSFSPDGKWLVYLGHHNKKDAWGVEPVHPWRVDLRNGKIKNLTPGYDRQAMDLSLSDIGFDFEEARVAWSKDSRSIFYPISDRGDVAIMRTPIAGGEPVKFWKAAGQAPIFDLRSNAMVVVHAGFSALGDFHLCEDISKKGASFRKVLAHNAEYLKSVQLSKVLDVKIPSTDGAKVHTFVFLPPDFSPRKKYPGVVFIHGGPRTQYARVFFHEMHVLAAQGYVVACPNPRGSQGYGKDWAESIVAAWGTKDWEDVEAVTDWLEAQKYVKSNRIGICGGSYGGYMTNWALGHTRRYRCGVTDRSVVELKTFHGSSDIGYYDHTEFGGHYWDNPEGYEWMSPLTYADKIRDPLLIVHSENDLRCAMEQAEQLFVALKVRGRTVEFLRFPEESHGLSRGGRPDRRVVRMEAYHEWFAKYLKK